MGGVDLTVCSQFSWNRVSIQHENNSSKAYVVTALFVGLNIFKRPATFVLPRYFHFRLSALVAYKRSGVYIIQISTAIGCGR